MPTVARSRPDSGEYAPFYHTYVSAVPDGDVVAVLRESGRELTRALSAVPEARWSHRYGDGKWTVREVVGHVSDAERIFAYRALRFARGDQTPLAAFDENAYVPTAGAEQRTLESLVGELAAVREASVRLFESLPDDAWMRRGTASGKEITVLALAYIVAGHALHHFRILRERYGVA
jgi:uncharacterized damage-inducible protein DinB